MAFYAICVLICLNVVVAFALDAFQENAESLQTIDTEEGVATVAPLTVEEDSISGGSPDQESPPGLQAGRSWRSRSRGSVYFDASVLSGTRTGLEHQEWRASMPNSIPVQQQRSILHKLMQAQAADASASGLLPQLSEASEPANDSHA